MPGDEAAMIRLWPYPHMSSRLKLPAGPSSGLDTQMHTKLGSSRTLEYLCSSTASAL